MQACTVSFVISALAMGTAPACAELCPPPFLLTWSTTCYACRPSLACLQDLSSNGTYVNGECVGRGRSLPLADGDRIALVLSVAPLAEQAWVYHAGGRSAILCCGVQGQAGCRAAVLEGSLRVVGIELPAGRLR